MMEALRVRNPGRQGTLSPLLEVDGVGQARACGTLDPELDTVQRAVFSEEPDLLSRSQV